MRPKTLSAVVILFILLSALTCFSQQTEVTQFAAFGAYSYLSTPSLNLTQRGFDGDFGYNYNSWLTLGFDFSYGSGHSSLVPNDLNQATQAKLAPFLPFLPPGFVLSVPYNSSTQTYEAGPQFNYRHFKHVTLFARPALGALHANFSYHAGQPAVATDCQGPAEREHVEVRHGSVLRLRRRSDVGDHTHTSVFVWPPTMLAIIFSRIC